MQNQSVPESNPAAGIGSVPVATAAWRVKALTVLPNYRLAVAFMDGRRGIVDCISILGATNPGTYAPLAAPDYFAQAYIDLGAITWPNGADIDPAWMYEALADEKMWSVSFQL
jgi:hypothetical protein